MDEIFLDIAFAFLALGVIFTRFIIPIILIALGIILLKKKNNKGVIPIVIGIIYLIFSIIRVILNIIIYGF